MHLKSLTLRGFKSFASSTTFQFGPGITCVVGPNGSGKSNVVDAVAWVLGEQGAKSLRGGKMEDVIFAGTAGRPPLGRAEVLLTIDNSDQALPIDYAEVTISRLMYRSGDSEYAINGHTCRLLDVQELLSDSGIGRELHVIVGQGQLDAVLQARPEDRRAFIEEAAGVLKHRKRKEKALRKLEAMQANLTRLTDLTAELRRQLAPLGRQAETARRAGVIQADLRDARLRLAADDLHALRSALAAELADEAAARARRAQLDRRAAQAAARQAELEALVAQAGPRLAAAQDDWFRLAAVRERLRAIRTVADERRRPAAGEPDGTPRLPPAELAEQADRAGAEAALAGTQLDGYRAELAAATAGRERAEAELAAADEVAAAAARDLADRRDDLARQATAVAATRSRAVATQAEIDRLTAAFGAADGRAGAAERELAAGESELAELTRAEAELDRRHETASAEVHAAGREVAGLEEDDRRRERERAAEQARHDALVLALRQRDGAAVLAAAPGGSPDDRLSPLAQVVQVEPGAEVAVGAALGELAGALVCRSAGQALAAVHRLKRDRSGRAALLVADRAAPTASRPALPDGARWAADLLSAPPPVRSVLDRLLRGVAVVADLTAARALLDRAPTLRVVTADGDVLTSDHLTGGSPTGPGTLELHRAAEDAGRRLTEITHRGERLRFALASARARHQAAQQRATAVLAEVHRSDARIAAVSDRLGRLGALARAAREEAGRLARARAEAEVTRDRELAALDRLLHRHEQLTADRDRAPTTPADRQRLAGCAVTARAAEVDARLQVRAAEERARLLAARAAELAGAAERARLAERRAAELAGRRARRTALAEQVAAAAATALRRLDESLAAAEAERAAAETSRAVHEGELLSARANVRELADELATLTDSLHRDEVARTEQRLRIEALESRVLDDYGIDPTALLDSYGPAVPVPVTDQPDAPPREYRREEQERRAREAERALARLGAVNPLALEEYAALEERHRFLSEQLTDLKATRRDLLTVVREVDERVEQVFGAAFEDTAREFQSVFGMLFPGGEGRLLLTDPTDLLATGVEIEARPPGKRIRRLSLLSGGERSLTAIALLVAIFRARPSPFYVLDEVEAALDDRNLARFIDLLTDLRNGSQLLVVTHQKRTMETADALYGTSMSSDGVTRVVSQRIRELV